MYYKLFGSGLIAIAMNGFDLIRFKPDGESCQDGGVQLFGPFVPLLFSVGLENLEEKRRFLKKSETRTRR
jgi:hypothetical protein